MALTIGMAVLYEEQLVRVVLKDRLKLFSGSVSRPHWRIIAWSEVFYSHLPGVRRRSLDPKNGNPLLSAAMAQCRFGLMAF